MLRSLVRRWRQGPPRGLILGYHRVHERDSPYHNGVSPQRLKEHLEVLLGHFSVLPLTRALQERQGPWAVLTFDDGYADSLTEALPILESRDLPATFFVTTGVIMTGQEYWWDEILRYPRPRWRYRRLIRASPQRQRQELERLRGGPPAPARADLRPLRPEELVQLSRHPLVEIGAHTVDHAALPWQDLPEQGREIQEGRRGLEELLGRAVTSFAYPYGWHSAQTRSLVGGAGFARACTTEPATLGADPDPLRLPRFTVRDWSAARFEEQLLRWWRWS